MLAAHDGDAAVRPGEQEARLVGAPAHAVIASAEAAADQHGDLRHLRSGDRCHQFRAMLGDTFGLILSADHEARNVLQEEQRDAPLAGQLDEVCAFLGALGIQHAIIGEDRDRHAPDMREAADQRGAIERLELMELRSIDQPRNDLLDVEGRAQVRRQDAVNVFGRV